MSNDAVSSRSPSRENNRPSPNILLIHCHDLGQHLGCYGREVATPNLTTLADEGVLFENHFTTAPQCSPSRGSLWTGLPPHVNGLLGLEHSGWELHDSVTALPERLVAQGYETHLFGLQHVTDAPRGFGYTHLHPEAGTSSILTAERHHVNRAQSVADTVTDFLHDAPDTPFFASVGFFEAHRADMGDRYGFNEDWYDTPHPDEVSRLPYLPDRYEIRQDIAAMNGMIRAVDDAVGRIDTALNEARLTDDTLVVFTTEHGIAFPRAKGSCFDPGIEAALIARYPGVFDGGDRYSELLSNVDVLPTILDLVAGEPPTDVAGRSFLPLVTDEEYEVRDQVFAEITWHDRYDPVRTIRTPEYKFIRSFWHRPPVYLPDDVFKSRAGRAVREEYHSGTRTYEKLYNLKSDPHEQDNLADDDAYADVKAGLNNCLVTRMEATDDPLLNGPVPPADYDIIEPTS